jgi:hypothetical protein
MMGTALRGGCDPGATIVNEHFVVRLVTADGATHEIECAGGEIVDWSRQHSDRSVPVLEIAIPRVFDVLEEAVVPFCEDARLNGEVLLGDGSALSRLFPLSITGMSEPAELFDDFRMLWIMRDGPFGDFAWRNVFVEGRCDLNDAAAIDAGDAMPWDVIVEADFTDCIGFFLGDLEIRDMLARGQVQGAVAALSTLTWFVERDEMVERAQRQRLRAELLRDWVTIARSDRILAWVRQLYS